MRRFHLAILAALFGGSAANAAVVGVGNDPTAWLGFMNVFDLGGNFIFNSGWGVGDLSATFNDASHQLRLSPNSINDPNPFWYTPSGGPGSTGNKIMDANLYVEVNDNSLSGQNVTFEGTVLSNTFTSAHVASIFIRDFSLDFSSVNQVSIPLVPGPFSFSLATIAAGPGRHVQYGFEVRGPDVWITDTGPFGSAIIATIPQPSTMALVLVSGLMTTRRRRTA